VSTEQDTGVRGMHRASVPTFRCERILLVGEPGRRPRILFGVATADHQCEAYNPQSEDIRDVWEKVHKQTPRGRATDFWTRYPEDVKLAAELGCRAFRFSISWSRLEPDPGRFDPNVVEHYRALVDAIAAHGMEPILTLHHFTWPVHLEERGGMIAAEFPDLFQRYAEHAAEQFAGKVRYWITFNEPNQLIYGYIKPWWESTYMMPPGLPDDAEVEDQMAAVQQLIQNLFRAHTAARHVIRQHDPEALVGANPFLLGLPPWLQRLVDSHLDRVKSPQHFTRHGQQLARPPLLANISFLEPLLRLFTIISTALSGNWWHLGMAGRLPDFLCPPECRGQQDFVGFDYYWGIRTFNLASLGRLADAAAGRFDRAPVWPGVLYGMIRYHARLFPKLPLLIVENGCVETAGGVDRATYIRRHLREVARALRDGVNLIAYVCWSITSNREWGLVFGPGSDFGLYHIDLDDDPTLTRKRTPAADAYAEAIGEYVLRN